MAVDFGLKGQRVLLTGASQGIGFGAARAFLEEGARVVINSSTEVRLNRAATELKDLGEVHAVVADLRRHEDIDRLADTTERILGGLDTLVYVTGAPPTGTFMEQDYAAWAKAAELLMVSPAYLARRVAAGMISRGLGGRMVFLASTSIREPIPTIATSNVARISIAGIVRTLARELGPHQIRANGILPGFIQTDRSDEVIADIARRQKVTLEAAREILLRDIPLGRIGTTDELARTILYLGSELSAYVTGAMIPVDGGRLRSVG
jgi:3-oxoacyl-[acyl-carrier protein] reductase